MKRIVTTVLGSALVLMSVGAYAEDIGYKTHIKPLFNAKCSGCHGTESPELPEFEKDKKAYRDDEGTENGQLFAPYRLYWMAGYRCCNEKAG